LAAHLSFHMILALFQMKLHRKIFGKITILLLFLACGGRGRRLQRTPEPYEALRQLLLAPHPTGAFSIASPRSVSTRFGQSHLVPKTASSSARNLMLQNAGRQLYRTSAAVAFATQDSELPPTMDRGKAFSSGTLNSDVPAWWRQNYNTFQLVCAVPDDLSVRDDLSIETSDGKFVVKVGDTSVVDGALPYSINIDATEWLVEEDVEGFPAGPRYLVVELTKLEWWVDWPGPVATGSTAKRYAVGGCDEDAQKEATASQVAAFQTLAKLPCTTTLDIYSRPILGKVNESQYEYLHFLGRVAADEFIDTFAAIATQEMLIKQHGRLLWPEVYPGLKDDEIEIWMAPGFSEVAVASNELDLTKYEGPPEGVEWPPVEKIGYRAEGVFEGEIRLFVKKDANGHAEPDPVGDDDEPRGRILRPDQI